MARVKQSVTQRSFSYMAVREDFQESDDLEVRGQSVKAALNMRALATRVAEARPGTFRVRELEDGLDLIEVRPESGLKFGVLINDTSLQVLDEIGTIVFTQADVSWTKAENVWVEEFRDEVIIGDEVNGIFTLTYSDGVWSYGDFAFKDAAGGEIAQAYWSFRDDASIQPSGLEGDITVRATSGIWSEAYVGQRIRYGSREILVTEYVTAKVINGTVINRLPPSFRIVVADGSEYRVGEAVVAADTNFQGLIISKDGNSLDVVTIAFFEGPDVAEELSSSTTTSSSAIVTVTELNPLYSPIWDEPLMSPLRGYPRAAGAVSGRLVLLDFPHVPDLVALSSSRDIRDFTVGAEDDDAIVRQVGDNAPRWLHAVNMGDLLLLADKGAYFVPARDNGVISPSTFNTVFIDEVGVSEIAPVKVNDGVVFVEASGERVSAVLLDGNVRLKWSVRAMTTFHNHLIKSPTRLCGPSLGSASAEKYMFVINGDGTLAAVSWQGSLRDEVVGFSPWETQGNFRSLSPIFGGYWAVVERDIGGSTKRFLERFDDDAYLDCAIKASVASSGTFLSMNGDTLTMGGASLNMSPASLLPLAGSTVTYFADGWQGGEHEVNADGSVTDEPVVDGGWQVGFNFDAHLSPWPVELIDSPRIGMVKVRVMRVSVAFKGNAPLEIIRNGKSTRRGGHKAGEDLSMPPPVRDEIYRASVFGRRDQPEITYRKAGPGSFRILASTQEVQG